MSDAMDTFFNDEEEAVSEEVTQEDASSDSVFDIMDVVTDEEIAADAVKEDKVEQKEEVNDVVEDTVDEESSEKDTKEEENKADEPEIKKIEAKNGEEVVELNTKTTFKHKVDGEEVDVNLQDLLNNYSGKVAYDKKFQELSEEKSEYTTERKQVEDYIDKFAEKVHSKDVLGAMEYFASFAGIDGLNFRNQLREEMKPFFENQAGQSEEQVQLAKLQEENAYFKQQQESASAKDTQQQSQTALDSELKQIQEAHSLDDNALLDIYDELKASTKELITPQMIGELASRKQSISKSETLLTTSGVELEDRSTAVENLANLMNENKDFTDDDWADVIKQAYGEEPKKASKSKVSDKVKKSQEPEVKEVKQEKLGINSESIFDFDDL